MAEFLSLFIIGSLWWYIITGGFVIWAIFLTEKETLGWVITSLIIYLLFFSFLGKVNIFAYLFYHPINSLLYILSYFLFGIIWSFVKWWLKVNKTAQKCKEELERFLEKHRPRKSAVPEQYQTSQHQEKNLQEEWERHIKTTEYEKPIASKNKEKISVWIIYWPFSLLWALIHDFVRDLVEQFVIRFQKLYQSISDKAYKKIHIYSTEGTEIKDK